MQNSTSASHTLTTMAELEALYNEPPYGPAVVKEIDHINQTYRKLIEASPFFALATCGPDGLDCSPRGDPAGFVRVLDKKRSRYPTGAATTASTACAISSTIRVLRSCS